MVQKSIQMSKQSFIIFCEKIIQLNYFMIYWDLILPIRSKIYMYNLQLYNMYNLIFLYFSLSFFILYFLRIQ